MRRQSSADLRSVHVSGQTSVEQKERKHTWRFPEGEPKWYGLAPLRPCPYGHHIRLQLGSQGTLRLDSPVVNEFTSPGAQGRRLPLAQNTSRSPYNQL